jgi:hypothetical protein
MAMSWAFGFMFDIGKSFRTARCTEVVEQTVTNLGPRQAM